MSIYMYDVHTANEELNRVEEVHQYIEHLLLLIYKLQSWRVEQLLTNIQWHLQWWYYFSLINYYYYYCAIHFTHWHTHLQSSTIYPLAYYQLPHISIQFSVNSLC